MDLKVFDQNLTQGYSQDFNSDIFDNIDNIRLGKDYLEDIATKPPQNITVMKKPNTQCFFRLNPEWTIYVGVLWYPTNPEPYFVSPSIVDQIEDEVVRCQLFGGINNLGQLFAWPIRFPSDNSYPVSALDCALQATKKWIRIRTNLANKIYEPIFPYAELPEPIWPEITINNFLKLSFKDRIITGLDHKIIKQLRGEI